MREQLIKRFGEIAINPFANLPRKKGGRWTKD